MRTLRLAVTAGLVCAAASGSFPAFAEEPVTPQPAAADTAAPGPAAVPAVQAPAETVSAPADLMFVGHNLFTTSYLMPAGRWTVGTYFIGAGVTPWLMAATSPWLLTNYNMLNLVLKAGTPMGGATDRFSFETSAFKTYTGMWNLYKQMSVMFRGAVTHRWNGGWATHFGGSYQYFWNDDNPFSLRPTGWNNDRFTLAVGMLNELDLGGGYTLFIETGCLGTNYKYPFAHVGLSINRRFRWGYIQLGASMSRRAAPGGPKSPSDFSSTADYNSWAQSYYAGGLNSDYTIWQADQWIDFNLQGKTLLHPEIQVQYFF